MVRLYLHVLLAAWLTPGLAQPYRVPNNSEKRLPQHPRANQFEHLSVADGLSNNSVNCIIQDRSGFMWFGTNEGVNKYDGTTFTVFKPDPKQPTQSFQHSIITDLCEGDTNRIWAITEGGGLHEINTKTGRVTPHPIQGPSANRWNNQISVYADSRRTIWISTFAGLARYEPTRHHFTLYPSPDPEVSVKTVLEDRQHRLWVGTYDGLYLFDPLTGRFTPVRVPGLTGAQPSFLSLYLDQQDVLWLGTSTAGYSLFKLDLRHRPWTLVPYDAGGQIKPYIYRNTIHRDSTGIVWVGTTNGLHGIDPASDQVVTYQPDPNLTKGISSNNAQAVYHDQAGSIWIGTDNGIDRQAISTKPFRTYQVTQDDRLASRPENRANAVFSDQRGQLWFCNPTGLYRLPSRQQTFEQIPPDKIGSVGQHKNYVASFLADGPDGIWFGTSSGLYHLDQTSGQYTGYTSKIPAHFVTGYYVNNKLVGDLWIGGESGIASFNPRTRRYTYAYKPGTAGGLPDKYVYGMMVSRSGDVWVLINRLGICRINPKTGRLIRYTAGPKGHLTSNDVLSIYEDKAGIIWIGTHLGGLNRFDPRTGLFSAITHEDGIPGNSVRGITSDRAGYLWVSTDRGLCRADPRTNAILSYDFTDGLPSNEFKHNAVFRYGNQLIFGTDRGVVQFDPDQIGNNTRPFPVYITGLNVLDKPRPINDSLIRLTHDENRLSFSFAALDYEQPGQNQYAYQLVGIDPGWVQNGNRPAVNFTNLPPGTYTLRVKAANSDGFWSQHQASVRVLIQPPWWATWWAYCLYVLLAGGAIWGYIQFYTNRIRQRQELTLNRREADQLKAVDELKTRFFANITHELRTPLSLIIGPVEKLLLEGRFDQSMLTMVQRNAEQLLRLINQLLDLSKLEGNFMTVSFTQGNVPDFIDHTVALFERMADQQGITLQCTVDSLPDQASLFDADKWETILTNLLANALKFTPAGGHVTLTGTPVRTADELTAVRFELIDSGIGIAAGQLPHIFDRFYQVDTSSTRPYAGTGIGLALVHELVSLLGGSIAVESQLGVGTTFRLTLPVRPVSSATDVPRLSWTKPDQPIMEPLLQPTSTLLNGHSVGGQPLARLLVVEDNDELREFLVSELTQMYQVFQAVDGETGWTVAQTELPDIVLTDVMMPHINGYELTRRIKRHADTDHIAVIMLTAKAAQPSRIDGLLQGADDYLSKPFNIAELHLRIRNLITRQHRLGDHYRQQFALPPDEATPDTLNQDPFLRKIYALLDEHLDDSSLNVEWLAKQLSMDRKTLYRKVQSLVQLPPADLIRQYRLRKAAELLHSGRNVSETADLVGFSTPSHFATVFKEFYRQTPTEFMTTRAK